MWAFQLLGVTLGTLTPEVSLETIVPSPSVRNPLVCLAIMSKWNNHAGRDALRSTWLSNLDPKVMQYRFFVERPRLERNGLTPDATGAKGDFVALDTVRGRRDAKAWFNNTEQVLEMFTWILEHVAPSYIGRVDMDGYLCYEHMISVLQQSPRRLFFWGKYWCPHPAHPSWRLYRRADENFMVLSADLANITVAGFKDRRFRAHFGNGPVTFAVRFGPVTTEVHNIDGLSVLDDPFRIAHRFNLRGMPWPPWDGGNAMVPPTAWNPCARGLVWTHPLKKRNAIIAAGICGRHPAQCEQVGSRPRLPQLGRMCAYDFDGRVP